MADHTGGNKPLQLIRVNTIIVPIRYYCPVVDGE